jgi:hypothetical protein
MFVSYSLECLFSVTGGGLPGLMTDKSSFAGSDVLVDLGTRLITPVVRELYAVLVQVGVIVVEE